MKTRSGARRSREAPAPLSLPDHFARKGYLSVSDLVGPSWCEYNYQYGILSLSHLPPTLRPTSIITPSGTIIAPSTQLILEKEATLTEGKAVHTVLEKEVAPVQVAVETESREDGWALRMLNLWCDVKGLLQLEAGKGKSKGKEKACVREVPVYGWVDGVLVMGVVDEIEKRAMTFGDDQTRTIEGKEKKWASQEEWKKAQLRKESTSPKKPPPPRSKTLTAFFSSSQSASTTQERKPESKMKEGWGYFLSDTKTRISSWLPPVEDQFSARMQCMTYKRLFDGLVLGALSPSSSSALSFNPHATPMDWTHTFSALDLDPHQPLSEAFMRDASEVCWSWGTDLAAFLAKRGADVGTLDHFRLLLEEALSDIAQDASDGGGVGVIQEKLALTYRRQQSRARSSPRKRKKPSADSTLPTQTTLDLTPATVVEREEVGDEARKSIESLEGNQEVLQAIETALSSPPQPSLSLPPTPQKPSSLDVEPASSSIIGIVTFTHDPASLDAYLKGIIAMWRGARPLQGVSVEQTRRCWSCEWREGCEWRTAQSDAIASRPKLNQEEEEEEEFWTSLNPTSMPVRDSQGNVLDW